MNGDKAFVDTNLLIYLYSETEPLKTAKVMNEITKYERYISTQVLCEFCSVSIRKLQ
jgi:predicted nucleic acid-binding protein